MQSSASIVNVLNNYKVIFLGFVLLMVVILVYIRGTKKNYTLVEDCMKVIAPTIQKHFPKFENKIIQQSPNVLKVYAEGRKSCLFAILGFAMVPRQQMLSFLFNSILFRRKDQLVIEMPIKNDNPPLFVCAIFKKSYVKNINKKKYPDLKNYCKQQETSLPKNLTVITETRQLLGLVINQKTIPIWTENSQCLKIFYMSDSNKLSKYGFCVRLVIELKPKGMDKVPQLIEMVIQIVDKLSTVKMPESNKSHVQKKRNEASI